MAEKRKANVSLKIQGKHKGRNFKNSMSMASCPNEWLSFEPSDSLKPPLGTQAALIRSSPHKPTSSSFSGSLTRIDSKGRERFSASRVNLKKMEMDSSLTWESGTGMITKTRKDSQFQDFRCSLITLLCVRYFRTPFREPPKEHPLHLWEQWSSSTSFLVSNKEITFDSSLEHVHVKLKPKNKQENKPSHFLTILAWEMILILWKFRSRIKIRTILLIKTTD